MPWAVAAQGRGATLARLALWVSIAAAAFHAAYASPNTSWLIVLYLFASAATGAGGPWRKAFYSGLSGRAADRRRAAGVLLAHILGRGRGAVAGLCLLDRLVRGAGAAVPVPAWPAWGWLLIPFVWIGLEYFRSELYYLRFSWLNAGLRLCRRALAGAVAARRGCTASVSCSSVSRARRLLWRKSRIQASLAVLVAWAWRHLPLGALLAAAGQPLGPRQQVRIAGVQMEFPTDERSAAPAE